MESRYSSALAASIAGTAAPLNLAYRYDEFVFYLDDTKARLLIVPPEGGDDARKAAEAAGIPVYTANMTDGTLTFGDGVHGATPAADPTPDQIALILHTSGSTGRPSASPSRTATSQCPPRILRLTINSPRMTSHSA